MTASELRAWVEARGLTQSEAAALLGLTRNGLQRQLYGERRVGKQTQRIIALLDHGSAIPPALSLGAKARVG